MSGKILGLIACFISLYSHAQSPSQTPEQNWGGRAEMNGIKFDQFGDFQKKWKQVTVRFRKDSGEMRFTYANPLAMKTLISGSKDYPDGAVFAKIGMITEEDLAFPSSSVPSGAKRVQYMVRDHVKYKETGGWGYALFHGNGETYPEDPGVSAMACYACHRIVPQRGEVFSQPMNLSPFTKVTNTSLPSSFAEHLSFENVEASSLPTNIKSLLPAGVAQVRRLRSEIEEHIFNGTVNEIRPALAIEATKSGSPALIYNKNGSLFAVVFVDSENKKCVGEGKGKDLVSLSTAKMVDMKNPKNLLPEPVVERQKFCW